MQWLRKSSSGTIFIIFSPSPSSYRILHPLPTTHTDTDIPTPTWLPLTFTFKITTLLLINFFLVFSDHLCHFWTRSHFLISRTKTRICYHMWGWRGFLGVFFCSSWVFILLLRLSFDFLDDKCSSEQTNCCHVRVYVRLSVWFDFGVTSGALTGGVKVWIRVRFNI